MDLKDKNNLEKIAIVVVGYNRIDSLRRLLTSLLNTKYRGISVPLYISIDASCNHDLYDYVNSFNWPYGDKYVNIQKERLGLKKHIIQCGDLTRYFKAIVMLEDDLFVSEYFYDYVKQAVDFYGNNDRIGGIALYAKEMSFFNLPRIYQEDGSDAFLAQTPASWGQCWTMSSWDNFRKWYDQFNDDDFENIDIPLISKTWKAAWTKYFMAYLVCSNRYFVYPYKSLTTCFGDAGTHSKTSSTFGQNSIVTGEKKYIFRGVDEMVKYDVYDVNECLYEWLGYEKNDLYIDLYGFNQNTRNCRYIFSPLLMPYKVVKSFGLQMRPMELNVKYGIIGKGLYLYDTKEQVEGSRRKYGLPLNLTNYFLRSYNIRLLIEYAINEIPPIVRNKVLSLFK